MKKINSQSGFTLLEALVAISILMVAVAAPITIAQKGLSSAVYTKDQMIAAYLAQDAIEYIKNKRDQISINNNFDWLNLASFGSCLVTDEQTIGCQLDTVKNSDDFADDLSLYSSNNNLYRDKDGFYQYGEKPEDGKTKFTRQVQIELKDIGGKSDSALVTVNVNWPANNTLKVQTMIYNY